MTMGNIQIPKISVYSTDLIPPKNMTNVHTSRLLSSLKNLKTYQDLIIE